MVTLNSPLIFCFRWFKDYTELDYARSGNEATSDVTVDAGTFYDFDFFFIVVAEKLSWEKCILWRA